MIRKYKFEIFVLTINILIFGINIYNYINQSLLLPFFPIRGLNAFSFWYYVRTYNIGEISLFLSPVFIMVFSLTKVHQELNSGIYKSIILKQGYRKYFMKKLIIAYIKGISLICFSSITIFILGKIIFTDKIINVTEIMSVLDLPNFHNLDPYNYLFLTLILNSVFAITVINVYMIVQSRIRKSYVTLILSYTLIMLTNYIIYFVLTIFSVFARNINFFSLAESINIFQGYIPEVNIFVSVMYLLIWFIVSFIILIIIYSKKQRIFDIYD